MTLRTAIERGPKGKRAVAFALDWPGLSRGAKSPDLALDMLESYRERYLPVAELAALDREFSRAKRLEVTVDYVGSGSTDFWGISFSPSPVESEPMADEDIERKLRLLRACWAYFDAVATRVSPELAKGPRGGGRDRDHIWRHVVVNERDQFGRRLGMPRVPDGTPMRPEEVGPFREAYVERMLAYNAGEGRRMKNWNLPFLIRHTAYHVMDHTWEMLDKDLTTGETNAASRGIKAAVSPTNSSRRRTSTREH